MAKRGTRKYPEPRVRTTLELPAALVEEFDRYFASTAEPRNRLIEQAMRLMLDMAKVRDGHPQTAQ